MGDALVFGVSVRAVLEMAGVTDCLTKCFGSNNPVNMLKATFDALEQLRTRERVAELRGVEIDNNTQLGIIPAYMITDNFALELLAATPFKHDIDVKGTNISAGSIKHLPPTLSLQWYPRGGKDGWQPYLGLGLNYTFIFDEEVDSDLEDALGALIGAERVDLEVDDSFGFSAQAGVDIPLGEHWGINAGVWYIDIDTTATIKTDVGNVKFDVDIDPWVYNIGIAYKF